jgi:hypothetical protein
MPFGFQDLLEWQWFLVKSFQANVEIPDQQKWAR